MRSFIFYSGFFVALNLSLSWFYAQVAGITGLL